METWREWVSGMNFLLRAYRGDSGWLKAYRGLRDRLLSEGRYGTVCAIIGDGLVCFGPWLGVNAPLVSRRPLEPGVPRHGSMSRPYSVSRTKSRTK